MNGASLNHKYVFFLCNVKLFLFFKKGDVKADFVLVVVCSTDCMSVALIGTKNLVLDFRAIMNNLHIPASMRNIPECHSRRICLYEATYGEIIIK